jgi:hypothetical protein
MVRECGAFDKPKLNDLRTAAQLIRIAGLVGTLLFPANA